MTPLGLLSIDFDGTACDESASPPVAREFIDALAAHRQRGAAWVVNTGRSLPHTLDGLVHGGFPFAPDFLVTRERDIHVRNAVGRWIPHGDWNKRSESELHRLLRRARPLLRQVRQFLKAKTMATYLDLDDEPAGIISSNLQEMEQICAFIDPLLPDCPSLRYERNSIYLRFSHADFTKGSCLAHLASSLGLPRDALFAAGDNFNDLPMLDPRIAAHLACPSNALRAIQTHVIAANGFCAPAPASRGTALALARLLPA